MNSELKDKVFEVPSEILKHLFGIHKNTSDKSLRGYMRVKNILKEKTITYHQLKRMIHDMKSYDNDSVEYSVNGGEKMFKWATGVLEQAREEIKSRKKSRQNAADLTPGLKNAYRKTHEKDGDVVTIDVSRLSEDVKAMIRLINR